MSYNESLSANSNYPPMSQSEWDNAPFSQVDVPEKDFDVTISQSLSKAVTVCTNDYIPEYDEEDGNTYTNTSDTNWGKAYREEHYTPLDLIKMLSCLLSDELVEAQENAKNENQEIANLAKRQVKRLKRLIDECEGWTNDETEIIQS